MNQRNIQTSTERIGVSRVLRAGGPDVIAVTAEDLDILEKSPEHAPH